VSATGASPWPVPIQALGPSNVATVVFRHRGAFHLTVIVKSSFQWMQGQRCQVATAEPITRADRPWEGEGARSPERASDIAPFLPRAEVRVTGHAYAPPGVMVPASSVRLGVFRDVSLVEKTIHVYGDRRSVREGPRPFQRMPLRYELAYGGPGTDNPAGVSAASGGTPNLVAPDDAQRPAAFAAIGRTWPSRARHAKQIAGLDAPIYDLADDFDFSYFQAAPPDQQIDALGGDEWLLLDGMHPSAPRLSAQLPGARAEALVWAETGPSAGMRWSPPLALDTVVVDGDKHRVDLVWRGSFTLPGGDGLVPDLRAAAGLDAGQALVWPDVEAAMLTRKRAALVLPSVEETNPEPEPLQRQETLAIMDAVGSALPFAQTPHAATPNAVAPASRAAPATGLPWDAPPIRPSLSSVTGGDTPLPDENTPLPALPFSRIAPEALAAADPTFVGQDVESTYEALATSSTAPPPPAEGAPAVELPRPAPVPVVVPPPAVPSGPLGGGMSLGYESKGFSPPAPPPLMQPPVPPARVSLPSISSEAPVVLHDDADMPGTATVVRPMPIDEPSSDRTDVRGPSREATRFESESTETTAPEGLVPSAVAPPPPMVAPPPPVVAPPPPIAPGPVAGASLAASSVAAPAPLPAPSVPPAPRASVPAPEQLDDRERLRRRIAAGEDLAGEDFARQDLSGLDFQGASVVRASFAGANLRGCNLARVKLADAKLAGVDLESADLTGADLTRADLTRARLGKAVLRDAQITQANLVGADAEGADFSGTKGSRVNLSRARLRGSSFVGADLPSADLTGTVLEGADLRGAQLADAVLDDARCDDAHFDEARLVRVRGHGASLARATLVRVVASGSNWDRATFDGADATGCDFADAALLRTSLAGAIFKDADLRGAKLANATGDDVDFTSSRFDGADLRQARLDGAKLDGAALVKVVATKVSLMRASLANADLKAGNFRGAKLKAADLGGASLRDADLRDADLEDARLDGADRTGARLQGANLDGATGLDPTNA
jgi:uncharacterized protein YjbI with pentapeptide repeats